MLQALRKNRATVRYTRIAAISGLGLILPQAALADLVNRWSFDNAAGSAPSGTTLTDSISAAPAVIRGNGATFVGNGVRISGTTTGNEAAATISAYIDLPNGIVSSKTDFSIEIWATPLSANGWSRLFDFGRVAQAGSGGGAPGEILDGAGAPGATTPMDDLTMSFARVDNLNLQRLRAINDGNDNPIDISLPTTAGTRYHYVCTYESGIGAFGAGGGRVSWYRDGSLAETSDVSFPLSALDDVNNWLGRSSFTNDPMANASFEEVRIYDHALTPYEVSAGTAAGPDVLPEPPEPVDPPVPDHLWTFTVQADSAAESGTVFTDEIGGSWEAVLRGNGGSLNGTGVVLPGNTNGNQSAAAISAYLDLSNGIISASPSITIEAWATPVSSKFWQRLFDFGRCVQTAGPGAVTGEINDGVAAPGNTGAWDNLSLTLNEGDNMNSQQLEGEYDDNGPVFTFSTAATTPGTEYHYVLIVEDGVGEFGANGCRASWYRDGILRNSDDFNFRLVDMEDVNNWIGRSMYTSDSNSNLELNELRIYRRAISSDEVHASYSEGPDPSSGPPEPPVPAPIPDRRWDFNTTAGPAAAGTSFLDSATGEVATLHGNRATLSGTELVLPGGTNGNQSAQDISAYLELPNGFVSSFESLTIEAWITPLSSRDWQRVFDFGNCTTTHGPGALPGEIIDDESANGGFNANDNLFLSLNNAGALGSHRLGGKLNAGTETASNTDLSGATEEDTRYHFVMTVEDGAGAAGGCQVRWFRDGTSYGSIDLGFRLADLDDVNNWIGRSNWSADQNSHMAIDELRVHSRAISAQEVQASYDAGADADFPPPTANPDTALLHAGQKVLVDVLGNDSGGPLRDSVEIVSPPARGTATVQPSGNILYAHDNSGNDPDSFTYRVSGIGGISAPATVSVTLSTDLRIANPDLAMPTSLPPSTWQLVDGLPGLTFDEPICLASLPGDTSRLFVGERLAKIQLVPDVTATSPTKQLFLDIQQVVAGRSPSETVQNWSLGENGLLGMAFHPDFANNGTFFVAYTVRINNGAYYQRVSRFTTESGNPDLGDPDSEVVLIQQEDDSFNHNGGDLHFGPDGYLYYAAGDEDNSPVGQRNSQMIDGDFFCGVFRLDVDLEPEDHTGSDGTGGDDDSLPPNPHPAVVLHGGNPAFEVPVDNPFVHTSLGGDWDGTYQGEQILPLANVRTEFWATGLRHTWRMSFDPETGDLWGGDVGQVTYEEINRIERGVDYGWAYREGAHDFSGVLGTPPAGFSSTDPFYEYVHTGVSGGDASFKGNSVCGGYVYRGTRFPELVGDYVFCDSVSGHVWRMDTGTGQVDRLTGMPGEYGVFSSQGVDPSNRDLLFCAYNDGRIMRLTTGSEVADGFPATLGETGLFADLTDLSPAPGLLPVEPNLRFWSDHAEKRRWFAVPDDYSLMTWRKEGNWDYPNGMLWVKHFDLAMSRDNPATNRRIETRVLVKTDEGVYGVSYRWNDEQTEAFLVGDAGAEFDIEIDDHGTPHTQRYQIPARASCLTCHGDSPLSFNTRQLNRTADMNGFAGNQISLLASAGYLENTPDPIHTLPRHVRPDETSEPLEIRARSYFDVNCSYCHQDGGSVGGFWDGRSELSLEETGLINGIAVGDGGNPMNRYVVPGDTAHSIVLSRVAASNGFTRMPPLATSELDHEAIGLLTEWIQSELPSHQLYDDWRDGFFATNDPDGDRDADPDGDGLTNYREFLRGDSPLSGGSAWTAEITPASNFRFLRKAFRHYDILTSTDLEDWESWDVPENHRSYMTSDQWEEIPIGSGTDATRFFRLRISEP